MGLTDPAGDTGRLLAELDIDAVARLDDVDAIKTLVLRCIQQATAGTAHAPTRDSVMRFSRAGTTGLLARFWTSWRWANAAPANSQSAAEGVHRLRSAGLWVKLQNSLATSGPGSPCPA